ncbi:hypothetical protein VMCG_06558 [Cytospora schulzeri]|uniref:Uncharacterized protein n=1 Tax=Cytospora schulzeri TaxID=448051 RepID=A0A423WBV1_9PEZI|nr:hypothetical protein VMCG_06558 [Valsa malicola]
MSLTPPVQKDGFSFVGDSFYREASNSNNHRRATVPELKAHFSGRDTENRPAHWYEAQLLHYGLPPSKVKGTAHKRLFDAVMARNGLTVPAHIQKIEADLKKEWNKKEREAKKAMKAEQSSTNVSVNVSVQVSSTGAVKVGAAEPAAKKAKTGGASSSTTTPKRTTTAASKEKKTTTTKAQKIDGKGKSASSSKTAKPDTKAKAPAKPTAKRPAAKAKAPVKSAAKRPAASSSTGTVDPAYGALVNPRRRGIGLLNGRYSVSCPYIEDNFPGRLNGLGLIATLDGDSLWLKFDFAPAVTGLMKVDRPYEPDEEMILFWRGHALDWAGNRRFFNVDTIYRAGPENRLRFLGGGHIQGMINYDRGDIEFDAYRLPGQSMTSEISPAQARAEWVQLGQNMDTLW